MKLVNIIESTSIINIERSVVYLYLYLHLHLYLYLYLYLYLCKSKRGESSMIKENTIVLVI